MVCLRSLTGSAMEDSIHPGCTRKTYEVVVALIEGDFGARRQRVENAKSTLRKTLQNRPR